MAGGGLPRGTLTFLFTDLEGSTHLLQRLGDRYPGLLATHYELMRNAFGRRRGREVGTRGDALFVVFEQAYGYDEAGAKRKHYYVRESVGISVGFLLASLHAAGSRR